ncbi:glycosyltransferase family 2 protein [Agrobacterium tumefaciens]|uniref:glycosyltransferase family 2 protein n=1 Tax=Agrobacterium tumefaciens TaxID=358 RepID=UPI0021CF09EE|nr:glycosyltransferase family 2 protein [Agrobacterium tumefaciens]
MRRNLEKRVLGLPGEVLPVDRLSTVPVSQAGEQSAIVYWSESLPAHVLFVLALASLIVVVPEGVLFGANTGLLFGLGALAVWRYFWGILHFVRSNIYRSVVFPKMRLRADRHLLQSAENGQAPHAYLIVTSFRIDGDTTAEVYRAAFRAALSSRGGATVVASIVEMSDQRLIRSMHRLICGEKTSVRLVITRINGSGKRDALAYAFRAVSKLEPRADDVVAVIDGDSIVPENLVDRCAGFFADGRVGALTTDETSRVRGKSSFHIWYSLRFAQRHILMSSNGLSRRVLTLTGRMSMFRASVITNPEFIRQVESDYIEHWRLGRLKFLTGDDKSSWYWLLRNNYQMLYLPDVSVATVEDPPTSGFFQAAAQLMTRWFGNMLRTNSRALALGPWRIGYFTWWTIFDQRISMWTSLAGLVMVILIGLFDNPFIFPAYIAWVLLTRYIMTLMLFNSRPRVSIFYPFFIYFNQVFGSIIKTYIFFHLDRQKWTRQKTTLSSSGAGRAVALKNASSTYMHVLSITLFVTLISLLVGQLSVPGIGATTAIFGMR